MFKRKTSLLFFLAGLLTVVLLVPIALANASVELRSPSLTIANPPSGYGPNLSCPLTEEQRQQLIPLWEQKMQTQKKLLEKKVELGLLTPEQQNTRVKQLEARFQHHQELVCGFSLGNGAGKGQYGKHADGHRGGAGHTKGHRHRDAQMN